jgi:hypothetical protein
MMKESEKKMRCKYPIEYELNPTVVDHGIHWLTFKLKNVGSVTLRNLDVRLHSLDTLHIAFYGTGHYIDELKPNEQKEVVNRVNVYGSANVYASISATKNGEYIWWESGWTHIKLNEEKAELESLLVLSHPYTLMGRTLEVEARIKGLHRSKGLKLELWVETPSGNYEELANIETKELGVGEKARYSAEFTPKETGCYTLHAYLYDGWKRIGTKWDTHYTRKNM